MTPLFAEKRKCEVGMNNEKKNKRETFMEYSNFYDNFVQSISDVETLSQIQHG